MTSLNHSDTRTQFDLLFANYWNEPDPRRRSSFPPSGFLNTTLRICSMGLPGTLFQSYLSSAPVKSGNYVSLNLYQSECQLVIIQDRRLWPRRTASSRYVGCTAVPGRKHNHVVLRQQCLQRLFHRCVHTPSACALLITYARIMLCFLFCSVFWDLYCAAPERRETCEHSSEAKAFHDYVSWWSLDGTT